MPKLALGNRGVRRGPAPSGAGKKKTMLMPNTLLSLVSGEAIKTYTDAGFWGSDTIYDVLAKQARENAEHVAVRDRFCRLTYVQLLALADAFADDLDRRGVRPGQRVAAWLPSRIEAIITLLACSRNGYVCCPSLHRDHTVQQIAELMQRVRASVLVVQTGYGADAERHDIVEACSKIGSLLHVYRLNEPSNQIDPSFPTQPATRLSTHRKTDPNQIVYLAFTSGTTGEPKGVLHSDNTLLANARSISADWQIDSTSVIYTLSPLSHNLGFGAMILSLYAGGELVIHDLPGGASLIDRLVETGTTFLFGVPTHAIDLLRELRVRRQKGIGRLKGFRISGAAAPKDAVAELLANGIVPQSGYGMTETCSHQYTLPNDDRQKIIETSGRACPGYEIRIWKTDDPDTEAPIGETGQIGGRGASLMLGYFDDQASTENSFNKHGWFMTGDLGSLDADSYLKITGRKKDIIIRGGHNIYPERIEAFLMRHEAIERAAAVALPDERLGEKVCLVAMPRDGHAVTADQMLNHLDEAGLSKYDMPEFFIAVSAMPLTPSGKIRKRDLVGMIARGELTPQPVRFIQQVRQTL